MNDDKYDEEYKLLEQRLRPELTPLFLQTLVMAARSAGWGVDYVEVAQFVQWCHDVADVQCPKEMEPFLDSD